jgi:hypothetical protein
MTFINLTPHSVSLMRDGSVLHISPEPIPARCEEAETLSATVAGYPVYNVTFGTVYGLPEPKEGVLYIVSRMVAEALPDRHDLVFPHQLVRDSAGNIVGCQALGEAWA